MKMKKIAITLGPALLLLVFTLMASLPAAADGLSPISDQFTVYDPDGGIYAQMTLHEDGTLDYTGSDTDPNAGASCEPGSSGDCSTENPNNTYYFTDSTLADQDGTAGPTVLCETATCDKSTGTASDIFGTAGPETTLYLAFSSDSDPATAPFAIFGEYVLPETGEPVDATQYLNLEIKAIGYTATFQSDPPETSVPEPGTLTLLAAGLLGLALMAGSLKRKALCSSSISA